MLFENVEWVCKERIFYETHREGNWRFLYASSGIPRGSAVMVVDECASVLVEVL